MYRIISSIKDGDKELLIVEYYDSYYLQFRDEYYVSDFTIFSRKAIEIISNQDNLLSGKLEDNDQVELFWYWEIKGDKQELKLEISFYNSVDNHIFTLVTDYRDVVMLCKNLLKN